MRLALVALASSLATMALDLWLARRVYGRWPWERAARFPWEERP